MKVRGVFSWFFALLLTLVLLLTVVSVPVAQLWAKPELLRNAISDPTAVDLMGQQLQGELDSLSETYGIDPETLRCAVTRESVAVYAGEMADWLQAILLKPDTPLPVYDTEALEAAVKEDEIFQSNHPASQLRTISREAGWQVQRLVQRTVLPLRVSLFETVGVKLGESESVTRALEWVRWLPLMLLGVCVLLTLLLCLIGKPHREGLRWAGAALLSALALCVAAYVLIATKGQWFGNAVLIAQCKLLCGALSWTLIWCGAGMLILGILLILLGRREPES